LKSIPSLKSNKKSIESINDNSNRNKVSKLNEQPLEIKEDNELDISNLSLDNVVTLTTQIKTKEENDTQKLHKLKAKSLVPKLNLFPIGGGDNLDTKKDDFYDENVQVTTVNNNNNNEKDCKNNKKFKDFNEEFMDDYENFSPSWRIECKKINLKK
jgi:hypothetical protein